MADTKKRGFADIAQRGASSFKVDPNAIVFEEKFNTRKIDLTDPEQRRELDELKYAIEMFGLLQYPGVRYDPGTETAIAVFGHRRILAIRELVAEGKHEPLMPVVLVQGKDEQRRKGMNIAENIHVTLNDVELGEGFAALITSGMTVESIGAMMKAYTPAKIRACIALADSPRAVKDMVAAGEVQPAAARQAVARHGDSATTVLQQKVAEAKAAGKPTVTRTRTASSKPPREADATADAQSEALVDLTGYIVKSGLFDAESDSLTIEIPARYVRASVIALYGPQDARLAKITPADATATGDAA